MLNLIFPQLIDLINALAQLYIKVFCKEHNNFTQFCNEEIQIILVKAKMVDNLAQLFDRLFMQVITWENLTNALYAAGVKLEFKDKVVVLLLLWVVIASTLFHVQVKVFLSNVEDGVYNEMQVQLTFKEAFIHEQVDEVQVDSRLQLNFVIIS